MARATTSRPAVSSTTTTITLEDPSQLRQQPETIVLRLSRPPSRKKVTWKEGTVDNEFLQRKSSKKCCIFNKQKSFDEDDSDDDDHDHKHESGPSNKDTHDSGGGCCSKDSGEGSSASCSGEK